MVDLESSLCSLRHVGGGWIPPINERGLPSIDLFVLVISEDNSELTMGGSGGTGVNRPREP